jgi:hypothetical protein
VTGLLVNDYSQRNPPSLGEAMSGLLGNWGGNIEQGLLSALPVLAENDPYKIGQQLLREGAGVGGIASKGTMKDIYPFSKDTGLTDIDDLFNLPHLRDYFKNEKRKQAYQVDVPPSDYLDALRSKGFDVDSGLVQSRVDEYAERMLAGDKFPALSYDISRGNISQEGRNRAAAAVAAGVNRVPVSVMYAPGKAGDIPEMLRTQGLLDVVEKETKTDSGLLDALIEELYRE